MTVATEVSSARFTGIVDAVPLACPFPAQATSQVVVRYGDDVIATEGVDYTVALAVDFLSFSVTPLAGFAVTSGGICTVSREVPYLQDFDLLTRGEIGSSNLVKALDYLTFIGQQLKALYSRALTFPANDAAASIGAMPLAADRANMYLAFDADGKPVAAAAVSSEGSPMTAFGVAWVALVSKALARAYLDVVSKTDDETINGDKTLTGNNVHSGDNDFTGNNDFTTGQIFVPTVTQGDSDTSAASSAFVQAAVANRRGVTANSNLADTDRTIVYTALAASRTVTLPAANTMTAGRTVDIVDGSGSASEAVTISLVPTGADTIAGSNTTQVCINAPRGRCRVVCNGANGWDVLEWAVVYQNVVLGDVDLNNTGNFFPGPTVAQGAVGTWDAVGGVTVGDTAGSAQLYAKLWDTATVAASGGDNTAGASGYGHVSLAGRFTAPVGNITISCKDGTAVTGKIKANFTGAAKDSWLVVKRVA